MVTKEKITFAAMRGALKDLQLYNGIEGDVDKWSKEDLILGVKKLRSKLEQKGKDCIQLENLMLEFNRQPFWKKMFATFVE